MDVVLQRVRMAWVGGLMKTKWIEGVFAHGIFFQKKYEIHLFKLHANIECLLIFYIHNRLWSLFLVYVGLLSAESHPYDIVGPRQFVLNWRSSHKFEGKIAAYSSTQGVSSNSQVNYLLWNHDGRSSDIKSDMQFRRKLIIDARTGT